MSEKQPRYLSYLLRLWPVQENEHTTWRASLESAHTGERQGFADVEALSAFLREQTAILTTDLTDFGQTEFAQPVRSDEESV